MRSNVRRNCRKQFLPIDDRRRRCIQDTFTGDPVLLRMKMRFSHLAFVLVVALVSSLAAAAPAARPDETARQISLANTVSMDQAVRMAEQRFKARVVRAEAQHDGNHTVYVLRLLNESGRVWTVRVDASNGAVL
jgi:Peptidase propeptide and YPEB domain